MRSVEGEQRPAGGHAPAALECRRAARVSFGDPSRASDTAAASALATSPLVSVGNSSVIQPLIILSQQVEMPGWWLDNTREVAR